MNHSMVHSDLALPPFEDGQDDVGPENVSTVSGNVIIKDGVAVVVNVIFTVILGTLVGVSGIITNIINIIVFIKQGAYKECGTVNLLGLAVSDLCVAITMLQISFCYLMMVIDPPYLPWAPFALWYLFAVWPHLMFSQITRTITAYVAFERCMCVVFPFKVKTMLSPKRSIIIIVSIFLCFFCSFSPIFIKQQLRYKHDPAVNRSRVVLVQDSDWRYAVRPMYYTNSIAFNVGSVAAVLVFTLITSSRVQLSQTWRSSMATGNAQGGAADSVNEDTKTKSKPTAMSSSKMQKEKKLITMIVSISVIFLLCYIPDITLLIMATSDSGIKIFGKYHNLTMVMYSFVFLMETFNSSINIVIYYKMSSKYKRVFRDWIGLSTGDESLK